MIVTIESKGGGNTASGSTNWTALSLAIADVYYAGGGTVRLDNAGTYELALGASIELPSNVTVEGQGQNLTFLSRTDTSTVPTFIHTNGAGALTFRGFTFIGNNLTTTSGAGAGWDGQFLLVSLGWAATQDMRDFHFADMGFQGIGADGWIFFLYAENEPNGIGAPIPHAISHDIDGIWFEPGCTFKSTATAAAAGDIGRWSSSIVLQGPALAGSSGRIRNVLIDAPRFDIPHLKSMLVVWHGVEDVDLTRAVCERVGTDSSIAVDKGGYAVLLGNETAGASNPDRIRLTSVVVKNGKSVGVYGASWGGKGGSCEVTDCVFENITAYSSLGLPVGAIAYGDNGTEWRIRNLRANNVSYGVSGAQSKDCVLEVDGATITGLTENGAGIYLVASVYDPEDPSQSPVPSWEGPPSLCRVGNLVVEASASNTMGIRIDQVGNLGQFDLYGDNRIGVTESAIYSYDEQAGGAFTNLPDGFNFSGRLMIDGAHTPIILRGNRSPIRLEGAIAMVRGELTVRNYCLNVEGCTDVSISGRIQIDGLLSGDAVAIAGGTYDGLATGGALAMDVIRFTNIGSGASGLRASGWGTSAPVNTGNPGDFVANLLPANSSGQKVDGWWWNDTAGAWWVKRSDVAAS